jgi:nucleotide-binding universal stress UspA family protein
MTGIKVILVPICDADTGAIPLETALQLGARFQASVRALHVRADPSAAVPLVGEGMSGTMVEEMMNVAEQQAAERASRVRAMFEGLCGRYPPGPGGAGESLIERVGREEETAACFAKFSDLVVCAKPKQDRDPATALTLNAALMEGGRPVLLMPNVVNGKLGGRIAIAWNGSTEATRAIHAALPFLTEASAVTVLAAEDEESPDFGSAELAQYLGHHGVSATAHRFSPNGRDEGEALLAEAASVHADMLVMGAYTHSRLRQLILGGVTRHIMSHATIPVLLSH